MSTSTSKALLIVTLLAAPACAENWKGFQHGGQLTLNNDVNPKLEWSLDTGIAWDIQLAGYGQSSPVIQDQVIYVTSLSGKKKDDLHIQAIDRQSGQQLWRHDVKNNSPEENTNYVSRAAPSPVCDAKGVVAFFEGGNVVALSPQGKVRWERNLVADYGEIRARHGLGSSLEQDDQHVFVWVERQSDPYVVALAKENGQTVWKSEGIGATSWSSPRLIPIGQSYHLVISGTGKLAGIDPATGKRLWTFSDVSGNSTPTPVPAGNGRFLMGATTGRGGGDGSQAAQSNGLIQIEPADDGGFQARYVWQAQRATSSFGSPMVHDGNAYFVNRSGVVYCLKLETGEELYAKRAGASNWATPIGVDERVYLFGKDGTTTVIAAGEEFQELATNPLWGTDEKPEGQARPRMSFGGPVLYAAAIVDNDVILRRGDRLYRVGD